MSSRTPGEGRYAQLEREQRWRLTEIPLDLQERKEILDLYVTGTRLRLRTVTSDDDVVYKLAQKVRSNPDDPELVKITNVYLSRGEYEALAHLPAKSIRKVRCVYPSGGRRFAVDVFSDRHEGLVLAEVELQAHERRLAMPSFAVDEVTNDDRFSGGALAHATDREFTLLLRS